SSSTSASAAPSRPSRCARDDARRRPIAPDPMALPRLDPLPAFHFLVALLDTSSAFSTVASGASGLALGGFSECSGLESTLETVDYLEGGVNDRVHRFPSRMAYGTVTLRRGVGFSEDLWLWHQAFLDGKGTRRDGLIVLQNE